ncbi:hypothetical protein K493DRAFT_296837 [Basidiobolus meristosporus CBS 931.73]|uniref:CST complex subunit CTC1 n=1 Tax=Basidiobolus meristosporus CBS 931.73 TaxID=1314790 RepID=A0A1Y1Z357_9FUNG|nr:hypothetical protein K493DRAFT_296837 [Basidiobolus meristosporus CBS 931.73]|eukprot:ORY04713.1 hypothetical protein K493DRAFT_296837 [Basidiobolus meristosporus CBS 931.73]
MGPFKVIQVNDLITFRGNKRPLDSSESKFPFYPVLFGIVSLDTHNVSPYCKTLVFQDSSGTVRCYCPTYDETWLQRKVCLYSWNIVPLSHDMDRKRDPLSIALELLESPIAIDTDRFLQFASRPFSLNELRQLQVPELPVHFDPLLLSDCKAVTVLQLHQQFSSNVSPTPLDIENARNIFLYARVKSKSVLHRKKHSTTCFFLELEEAAVHNFPGSTVHLVFKGPYVIGQFYRMEVNEVYLFANLKVQTIFSRKPYARKVLAFDNQATKVLHATHPLVGTYLKKYSSQSPDRHRPGQDPALIDPHYTWTHVPPEKSSIIRGAVITYTGQISQVIDMVLGIFVLDEKYLLYLSHDPSFAPFSGLRIGTAIRLFNVHILVFNKASETCQVYFKRFLSAPPNYAIFVACTYSTVNIVTFSEKEVVARLPKFGSKFAPPRSRTRFNTIDLIHYQTLYYRMKDKFPGAFEDAHLLGPVDSGDHHQSGSDPNSSLLVLLLSRLGYTPYTRDLYREFFEHHQHCSTCVERYPTFSFPMLKEVLEKVGQCNGDGALGVEGVAIENKVSIRILRNTDEALNKTSLLGVLQGAPNGELQLSDLSGEVYATMLTDKEGRSEELRPEFLNNVWVIPEYEVVIENLGINLAHAEERLARTYVRFDISHAFCISKHGLEKPLIGPFPDEQQRHYLFRVKHIFPVKISFGVNNEAELSTLVEGTGQEIQPDAVPSRHLDAAATARPMFLRFTSDSMNLFPGLQIEQMYLCRNIIPFIEPGAADENPDKVEPSKPRRVSRSHPTKFNAFLVKAFSRIERVTIPTEASKAGPDQQAASAPEHMDPNKDTLDPSAEPIMEVSEIYALFEDSSAQEGVNQGLREAGKAGKMISFRGKVLKKEVKPSKARSFYTNEWHLFAFQNFGIGTGKGKQTLLLKIQDLANTTAVDLYLDLDKFVFPLGAIPGQIITVRKAALKCSESGNVYTIFTPSTYISTGTQRPIPTSMLHELEGYEDTLASSVPCRFLVEMQWERKKIFKCRCRVIDIQEITLRTTCLNCENIVRDGKCLLGCRQKEVSICGEARVNVEDGTLEAQVTFQDKDEIFKLLKLSNRMMERLVKAIRRAGELSYRITPHWQTNFDSELASEHETLMIDMKSDEERFLQHLCLGSRVKNELVLFVQKITGGDAYSKSGEVEARDATRSKYYVKTVRLNGATSIQTLTASKLVLKAVKVQEITTLAETLLVLNELEGLLPA